MGNPRASIPEPKMSRSKPLIRLIAHWHEHLHLHQSLCVKQRKTLRPCVYMVCLYLCRSRLSCRHININLSVNIWYICNVMRCDVMQCNLMYCSSSAVQCLVMNGAVCNVLYLTTLYCIVLYCSAVQRIWKLYTHTLYEYRACISTRIPLRQLC